MVRLLRSTTTYVLLRARCPVRCGEVLFGFATGNRAGTLVAKMDEIFRVLLEFDTLGIFAEPILQVTSTGPDEPERRVGEQSHYCQKGDRDLFLSVSVSVGVLASVLASVHIARFLFFHITLSRPLSKT